MKNVVLTKELPKGIKLRGSSFECLAVRTHIIDGKKKEVRKTATIKLGIPKNYTQEQLADVWDKKLEEAIKAKLQLDNLVSSYSQAMSIKHSGKAIKFGTLKEAWDLTFSKRWQGKECERNILVYKQDIFSFWSENTLLKDMQTDEQYFGFVSFMQKRILEREANYMGTFANTTTNRRLSALRCVFAEAIKQRWLTNEDMLNPDITKGNYGWVNLTAGLTKEKTPLDEEQIQEVVQTAVADGEPEFADGFIVMVDTGVRHREFEALTVDDVDYKDRSLRVLRSKTANKEGGVKYSYIPLTDRAYAIVAARRTDAMARPDRRLFKISYRHRRKLFDRYKEMCNLPEDFTPYATRHTFCTRLREAGVGKNALKDLAGHASLDTTERYYIKSSKKALKGAIGELNKTNTPLDAALKRKDPRMGHNSQHASVEELNLKSVELKNKVK